MMIADELIPTRQSLLSRLKDCADSSSWQDFFDTYWKLLYKTARKAGLNEAEAQDVVQETLLTTVRHMSDFRYDPDKGSFKGWLLNTTRWRIQDQFRRRQREQVESLESAANRHEALKVADSSQASMEANWEEDWESNLAEAAMERLKKEIAPKQIQIFDLAMVKQWPTSKIAKTLAVNPGYVYLVKHRVSSRLKREVRKLRKDLCEPWSCLPAQ